MASFHIEDKRLFQYVCVIFVLLGINEFLNILVTPGHGVDFLAFWSASLLALSGDAASAYDPMVIYAVEKQARPDVVSVFPWHYPPTFFLFIFWTSKLPFWIAYTVWTAGSALLACLAMVRLVPKQEVSIALIAAPLTFLVVGVGQSTFLIIALAALAWAYLDKRPLLAGFLFGLLSFKPHLGLLIPLALLCGREWRVFASATATVLGLAILSAFFFGFDTWEAFLSSSAVRSGTLDASLERQPTIYALSLTAGAGGAAAFALQGVAALGAAGFVGWVWTKSDSLTLRVGSLTAANLVASPFLFAYDLLTLAPAVALLTWRAVKDGWLPFERLSLILMALLPTFFSHILVFNLQLGILTPLIFIAILLRRMTPGSIPSKTKALYEEAPS